LFFTVAVVVCIQNIIIDPSCITTLIDNNLSLLQLLFKKCKYALKRNAKMVTQILTRPVNKLDSLKDKREISKPKWLKDFITK